MEKPFVVRCSLMREGIMVCLFAPFLIPTWGVAQRLFKDEPLDFSASLLFWEWLVFAGIFAAVYVWRAWRGESFEMRADAQGLTISRFFGQSRVLWNKAKRIEKELLWHEKRLQTRVQLLGEEGKVLARWWREDNEPLELHNALNALEAKIEEFTGQKIRDLGTPFHLSVSSDAAREVSWQVPLWELFPNWRQYSLRLAYWLVILVPTAFLLGLLGLMSQVSGIWNLLVFLPIFAVGWPFVSYSVGDNGIIRGQWFRSHLWSWTEIQSVHVSADGLSVTLKMVAESVKTSVNYANQTAGPPEVIEALRAFCERNGVAFVWTKDENPLLCQSKTGPDSKTGD